jgi:hypothetical protein
MGRPVGAFGEIAQALLRSAQEGPADVRTLAVKSQVGLRAAQVTVSRLVSRGRLVKADEAAQRRCKFMLPVQQPADASRGLAEALAAWSRNSSGSAGV